MARQRENVAKYALITGEDTYASQTAQNPSTSRRLQSLFPSAAADLARELPEALFATTALPGKVMSLFQFSRNAGVGAPISSISRTSGVVTLTLAYRPSNATAWLAAGGVAAVVVTGVYDESYNCSAYAIYSEPVVSGNTTYQLTFPQTKYPDSASTSGFVTPAVNAVNGAIQYFWFAATSTALYQWSANTWVHVTAAGTLAAPPVFTQIDDLLHMSDGASNWLFDGQSWVEDGLPLGAIPGSFYNTTPAVAVNSPAISSIARSQGVVTVTLASAATPSIWNANGRVVVAGVTDATFNGTFEVLDPILPAIAVGPLNPLIVHYAQAGPDTTSSGGTLTKLGFQVLTNKYYWYTFVDDFGTRAHESSTGPISLGTGAIATNSVVELALNPWTVTLASGSNIAEVTPFSPGPYVIPTNLLIGLYVWDGGGNVQNTIIGATPTYKVIGVRPSTTSGYHQLILDRNATSTGPVNGGAGAIIAPAKATGYNIYVSESENSKVGYLLATVPIGLVEYVDQSPFVGVQDSYIQGTTRPFRNDPPPSATIMEVHKYRIFRRREARPNFFNFSANEEVASGANGSPQQSVPGADINTQSDIVNEVSYPDDSNLIRGMVSHADALYIGTEKQALPLYGESIDDFALSQVSAFSMGFAGPKAAISTSHGLVFLSYDKKLYLYPTSNYPWAYVPENVNVTEQLIEIGRPLRNKLAKILTSDLWNVQMAFYNFNVRNWLVVCFQDNTSAYHTWVYDFETKVWFEMQRGFSSVDVWEPTPGVKVLIGGGTDGKVYVADDVTGTYVGTGNLPVATWRTALVDFGKPEIAHIPAYLEYEVSNPAMAPTVNYYLDPTDVDNLPQPSGTLTFTKEKIGSNLFRAFFGNGVLCRRLLVEFIFPSDTNTGKLRGVLLAANSAQENM